MVLASLCYPEGGEWITAYQAEQRSHLKAVMISSKLDAQRSRVVGPPTNTREASHHARTVLDRSFLLETCFVDAPGDLSVANVSGRELNDVSMHPMLKDVFIILMTITHFTV